MTTEKFSINLKRVLAVAVTLGLIATMVVIYKENTEIDISDGASFFKKYYVPHAGSLKKLMEFKHECTHAKIVEKEKLLGQPEQAYDASL